MAEVQEKWLKWVALSTTILAVCAAFAALKGGGFSTQVQLLTTKESNQWSYYQAKSIKLHLSELEKDILSVELLKDNNAAVKQEVTKKIQGLEKDIVRYDKEKDEIKAGADEIIAKQVALKRHGGNFSISVMFFQISIMLAAIGSLLRQQSAWYCGLMIGAVGILYFINGFLLFF